jgi:hypothetical protein
MCTAYSKNLLYILHQANYDLCLGVPPIVVFVALLVSILKLRREKIVDESQRRNRKASLTITYYSATFLFCNCFAFLNTSLYLVTKGLYGTYPGPLYSNNFMFFYSWLLSELFCTVLNATLNPLLYFWRMKEMRLWLFNHFDIRLSPSPGRKSSTDSQVDR